MSPRNRLALLIVVAGAHVLLLASLALQPRPVTLPLLDPKPASPMHRIVELARARPPDPFRAQRHARVAAHATPTPATDRAQAPQRVWPHRIAGAFGEDIAALMRLPLPEAWDSLEQLALGGDRAAGDALIELGQLCVPPAAGEAERAAQSFAPLLSPPDAAFVRNALLADERDATAFALACQGAGLGAPRLRALLAARGIAVGDEDVEAKFRSAFGSSLEEARRRLDPMTRLADALRDAGDDDPARIVARLSSSDPNALETLLDCVTAGCGAFAALAPEAARPWVDRAAELGLQSAIARRVESARSRPALADAYAWAAYGAWLARAQCTAAPGFLDFVARIQELDALRAQMDAATRAAAEQRANDLIVRLGPPALAAQGCAP